MSYHSRISFKRIFSGWNSQLFYYKFEFLIIHSRWVLHNKVYHQSWNWVWRCSPYRFISSVYRRKVLKNWFVGSRFGWLWWWTSVILGTLVVLPVLSFWRRWSCFWIHKCLRLLLNIWVFHNWRSFLLRWPRLINFLKLTLAIQLFKIWWIGRSLDWIQECRWLNYFPYLLRFRFRIHLILVFC